MTRKRRQSDEQPDASLDDLLEQPPVASDDTIQLESVDALPPTGSGSGDGFLDDDDFLPQERRSPSKLTVSLVAVLVLGVGIVGGIWIQKQFGAQSSAVAAGFPAGGGRGGFPGGGQGMPGSGTRPSGAADQTSNGGGGSTTDSEAPVVVGIVTKLESDQLTVEDLGGKTHTVTVSESTTVTLPFAHGELKTGDTVSITGSTTGNKVTASTITVR